MSLAATQPAQLYDLLLACSWETVRSFASNDKQLRGEAGAIAVLHTNTRQLDYHPHVHLVMPAGAIDLQAKRWRTKSNRKKAAGAYLFNHKALAKVFRAKLLAGLEAAGLRLPPSYPQDWVVDCKSVGNGQPALIYLGRYLYRGVIREQDIVRCAEGKVSFRYRDAQSGRMALRTMSGAEFLWLVLQHVLPKGFRRARNFGFLHPNCKRLITLLHVLLRFVPILATACVKPRTAVACPCCGSPMQIIKARIPAREPPRTPLTVFTARA
ncbi:MAG: family transposase, partial [Proteobacteria bacterium]|nr:family transposase [Pseudomonadota bacterium]